MPTASSLAWKTSLRKVRTLWQPAGWSGAFAFVDRGDIRQAIGLLQQYLGFTAGRWLWSAWSEARHSLIAKFKEGGTVREIDVWAESPQMTTLVICIIVCLSWAVNHYRDNAITYSSSATKMPENWSWRTRQLLTCRCVSVMLLRSMQNTRRS